MKLIIAPTIKKAELVYFGEHLLAQHPDYPVAIVESEKTALIASMEVPGVACCK